MKTKKYLTVISYISILFFMDGFGFVMAGEEVRDMDRDIKISSMKDGSADLNILIPQEIRASEKIPLQLTITNLGNESIEYTNWPHLSGFKIRVWSSSGKERVTVPLTKWGDSWMNYENESRFRVPGNKTILEKEKLVVEIDLRRYFDLTWPGQYSMEIEWFGLDPITGSPSRIFKTDNIDFNVGD